MSSKKRSRSVGAQFPAPAELFWTTEKRKISDLILFENNPRKLTKQQAAQLLESLQRFNLAEIPVIDQNNRVIAGNMRVKCLQSLGKAEDTIDVRVPSRPLTEDEAKEYLLRSNKNVGSWDFELLEHFDTNLLEYVGFDHYDLLKVDENLQGKYTRKIPTPIYEIKNLSCDLSECIDTTEFEKLKAEIDAADLPEDIRTFLILAAHRHIRFYYDRIAEYYAQCTDKKIRTLFENNALVIVDFNSAVERGWLQLYDDLINQLEYEYPE